MMSSVIPSEKYSCSGSPDMFSKGKHRDRRSVGWQRRPDARPDPPPIPEDALRQAGCSSVSVRPCLRMSRRLCPAPRHGLWPRRRCRPVRRCLQPGGDIDAVTIDVATLRPITSPRLMPIRRTMRRASGRGSLAVANFSCNSSAALTAFTALANSTSTPSPITLTIRPPCSFTTGSRIAFRRSRSAVSVTASSASMRRA